MAIDRAHTEVAAAGHGDFRAVESAEQRADEIIRSAQMLRHIVRHDVGVDSLCVDLERALAQALYACAELFENFCHIINIADVGNVFNNTYILSEDSCGQNSYDCVFSAAYADLSSEGYAAVEHELFQFVHSYIVFISKKQ